MLSAFRQINAGLVYWLLPWASIPMKRVRFLQSAPKIAPFVYWIEDVSLSRRREGIKTLTERQFIGAGPATSLAFEAEQSGSTPLAPAFLAVVPVNRRCS
jgi:hypothetical protein